MSFATSVGINGIPSSNVENNKVKGKPKDKGSRQGRELSKATT
jgi:hypothetical protein